MSQIRSRSLASWRTVPDTSQRSVASAGSPNSSAVTIHGPIGVNVSNDLRTDRSSPPRIVMSSSAVYPKTQPSASDAETFRARRPMTAASSPSWSKRRSWYGSDTVPPLPVSDDGAFRNRPSALTWEAWLISDWWSR